MSAALNPTSNKRLVERIADAVLYEGYILYPYRPSAVKNQQRWNFGALYPESYAVAQRGTESSTMCTQCLVEVNSSSKLDVRVRFLHLLLREVGEVTDCRGPVTDCGHVVDANSDHFALVPSFDLNGRILQTWQEAVEREVVVAQLKIGEIESPMSVGFHFPGSRTTEALTDSSSSMSAGLIVRTQHAISGDVEVSATKLSDHSPDETAKAQLVKLSIVIRNLTSFENTVEQSRDDALMHSFISTHTILEVHNGAFVSLLDPPDEYKAAVAHCANSGTYPVLAGNEGSRNFVLSSPIILYDYPQIAPESAGDLFDGTEIDEILTLRIMSLTDEEKCEMRSADELARQLLERTESLSAERMMRLHGVMKRS